MTKRILIACLTALALSSTAQALPYFGVHGEAAAVAISSDGVPGFDSMAGSPVEDPLFASADSVGELDVATAGSFVGLDLLTTTADVSGSDVSSAVATARYSGAFVNSSEVKVGLLFTWQDLATGSGAAATTLFVSLVSDGVSLFRDYVTGPWAITYTPVAGTTSLLDLVLTSEASAAFTSAGPGNASSFGQVSVVPEASTWMMLSLGLGAIVAFKRRRPAGGGAASMR